MTAPAGRTSAAGSGDGAGTQTNGRTGGAATFQTTAKSSVAVSAWTVVSRLTGLLRVVAVAAVLGPTFFGNLYQATNLLPNITYEFLTGSLFASLLVPAVVRHVDRGDRVATERLAGGFLGVALVAFAVVATLAVAAGQLVVRLLTLGLDDPQVAADQQRLGVVLLALLMPQVLLYGLVGTAVAVQNAHGRFAFPAAAPALENIGIIGVLGAYAVLFGTGTDIADIGVEELLLLGLGTTGAVALHAAAQWWGARQVGVTLRPRAGWRDPEVRAIIRLAVPSLGYAGLNASRLVAILVVASSVPGGVIAFQLAVNFYNLPVALGGRPVAQAMLPELSRAHRDGDESAFRDTLVRSASLTAFVTVPAAVAFVVLARPLAEAVSLGEMATATGIALLAAALTGLGAGTLGEAGFVVGTHASYARRDAATPLRVMALRTTVSVAGMAAAMLLTGPALLLALGIAVSAGDLLAAALIGVLLRRATSGGSARLLPGAVRALASSAAMAVPAHAVAVSLPGVVDGPLGQVLAVVGAALTGIVVYVVVQRLLHSPELRLLVTAVGLPRGVAGQPS